MKKILMGGAASLALIAGSAASAQDTTPNTNVAPTATEQADAPVEGNEILVTARRTSERLQDVPVAVSAFGGAALEDRNVATLDEIAKFTPNIRFDGAAALSGGNYNATVFVRGVGQNDFAIFSDPGVGFYVDDVYYARSIGGVLDAVDIDNVQVLRGPQGTLFGKNTIGGAVLINTATPNLNDVNGRVEATYGRFDRIDVKGAINIPIAPGVAALRISGASLNRDGYVKRLVDGDTQGDRSAQVIRAKLRIQPDGSPLTIDIGGDYTRARETSAPSDLLAVGNVPGITGIPFLTNYNQFVAPSRGIVAPNGQRTLNPSFITASPFETYAGGPNDNDLDLWGVQGIVSYDLGGATLKSITAYRHMKAYFTRDGDNTPFVFRQTTNRDKQWQFSQELQLDRQDLRRPAELCARRLLFQGKGVRHRHRRPCDRPPGAGRRRRRSPLRCSSRTTPTTAASQLMARSISRSSPGSASPRAGAIPATSKTFTSINVRQRDLVQFINVTKTANFKKFTPRLGVSYKASDDVLLYGSYSRGLQAGRLQRSPAGQRCRSHAISRPRS